MTDAIIASASGKDFGEIEALLQEAHLPTEGAERHLKHFLVAREGKILAGVIGLEAYGDQGLLRSLAVRDSLRSRGIGNALYLRLVDEARSLGIRRLVLLTTTAEKYFSARGFRTVDRKSITGELRHSAEFTGACPDSAVCMERVL